MNRDPSRRSASRPPPAEAAESGWEWVAEEPTLPGAEGTKGVAPLASRPLVLVVDDNAHSRDLYAEWLHELGCRVLAAHDGLEGLRLARTCLPDLVVVDVCMPVMDGCEMTYHLRRQDQTRRIPILAVTAFGSAWHDMARAYGCDAILGKPTMPNDFEAAVVQLTSKRDSRRP
jgi:CheY-like chemotaxis protein